MSRTRRLNPYLIVGTLWYGLAVAGWFSGMLGLPLISDWGFTQMLAVGGLVEAMGRWLSAPALSQSQMVVYATWLGLHVAIGASLWALLESWRRHAAEPAWRRSLAAWGVVEAIYCAVVAAMLWTGRLAV